MNLASFFAGVGFATFAASALFFLKFWNASRDKFFLYFALASGLLGVERFAVALVDHLATASGPRPETGIWAYLLRLTAFVVIFIGILRKNQLT